MIDPGWLTISEACNVLKFSRRTLYTYMESGDLPYYQVGGIGHRRIRFEDLDLLMVLSGSARKLPNAGSSTESVKHLVAEEHRILNERMQQDLQELAERERELEKLRPLEAWACWDILHRTDRCIADETSTPVGVASNTFPLTLIRDPEEEL